MINNRAEKEKKAEEAERLKEKKKQALKERMIEKKVEQAHMRGEIYIPSEQDKTEEKPDPKSSSKTSPVRKSEEKLEMLQKKVFVMPTGEPLPKNVAFLAENVDENRAQKYYKERKVKPGPEYEKKWGISYEQKQKNFNTYNALYCLCNPVYQWSRTDLFTKEQEKMAEDIRRLLRLDIFLLLQTRRDHPKSAPRSKTKLNQNHFICTQASSTKMLGIEKKIYRRRELIFELKTVDKTVKNWKKKRKRVPNLL